MELVHSLDLGGAFLRHIGGTNVSAFLFNVVRVNEARFWLLDLISKGEMILASLLWGHDFNVIQVDLVHSVIALSSIANRIRRMLDLPIQLSEDMLAEFIIGLEISTLMLSDELVHVRVNGHVVLLEL